MTHITPAVPKPAHVPDHLVYDFDYFHDPAEIQNPHERVLELHKKAPPIFWSPRQGGHWVLLGHSANFEAMRDWDSFSSEFVPHEQLFQAMANRPKGTPHTPVAVPINLNPPYHTKYRAPLQATFSPKAALMLKDSIRALANELIDKVIKQGRCEFMSAIAEPLPVQVFLKLMGLPLERQAEYRAMVRSHLGSIGTDEKTALSKLRDIADIMHDTIVARRDKPEDDIISMLWQTEIDGKPMTIDDMENYGVLLFIAGLDTVMNGMGIGVHHLARDQALQDKLRKQPDLIESAKEELLRRYTFTVPLRIVAKDIVFQGVEMKKGERALTFLPGADLDPREFPNPEEFKLNRENNVHIAFGAGPHRCLGSHLARVELQVLYEQFIGRMPPFRLDPAHPPQFHAGSVIGLDSLHLVWDV